MSNYRLQINGRVDLSDYSNIRDYMYIVNQNDKFTIDLNNNEEDADLLCSMLRKYNFSVLSKGGSIDGRYHISAIRNR